MKWTVFNDPECNDDVGECNRYVISQEGDSAIFHRQESVDSGEHTAPPHPEGRRVTGKTEWMVSRDRGKSDRGVTETFDSG